MDVDNDDDLDVFFIGIIGIEVLILKLYINDGVGNFFELLGVVLDGVFFGLVVFVDVSSDGNLDVFIIGKRGLGEGVIFKLYINEGVEFFLMEYLKIEIMFLFIVFFNFFILFMFFLSYDLVEISEVMISVYNINGVLFR